jgi:PilZ domain
VNERRLQRRFRVGLPVGLDGTTGITRDISASGVYFETSRGLLPGTLISFSVTFEHVGTGEPLHVQYEGDIVRVEALGEQFGVAVRILSYQVNAP